MARIARTASTVFAALLLLSIAAPAGFADEIQRIQELKECIDRTDPTRGQDPAWRDQKCPDTLEQAKQQLAELVDEQEQAVRETAAKAKRKSNSGGSGSGTDNATADADSALSGTNATGKGTGKGSGKKTQSAAASLPAIPTTAPSPLATSARESQATADPNDPCATIGSLGTTGLAPMGSTGPDVSIPGFGSTVPVNTDLISFATQQLQGACTGLLSTLGSIQLPPVPTVQARLAPGNFDVVKDAEGFGGFQQAAPGESITWHISVTNTTGAALSGTLTDTVPPGFGTPTTSESGPVTCVDGPTVTCTITALAGGDTAFVDIFQTVPDTFCGESPEPLIIVPNRADAFVTEDTVPSDSDTAAITVVCSPVLDVDKEVVGEGEQESGDTFQYLIRLENVGDQSVDAAITDDLPDALTFVSFTEDPTTANGGFDCEGGDVLECTVADLDPGDTVYVRVTMSIPDDVCATFGLENIVEAFVVPAEGADIPADADRELVHILCSDVFIEKESEFDSYSTGELIRYGLTVGNNGPGLATNVVVTDQLPTGMTFVSAVFESGSGSCGHSGGLVTCNLGDVPVTESQGDLYFIVITARITNQVECQGEVKNKAEVTADNEETGPILLCADCLPDATPRQGGTEAGLEVGGDENNSAKIHTPISCAPDIAITKTASEVDAGGTITYTITATNIGTIEASGVVVTDNLNDDLTGVSAAPSQGTCSLGAGNTVGCQIGTLAVNASATVTITATVPASACPTITNSASGAAIREPVGARDNNTASVTTNIGDCVEGVGFTRAEVVQLAATGAELTPLFAMALLFLMAGAAALYATRERKRA